jgi:hypothetical protein
MKRPRFTIAGLLGSIVFLAVGLAALREATDVWDHGVFGVTLAALLASVLLTIHRAGARRAYWLGFALFGGTYLVLSLVPPIERRLPTTKGLAYLDSQVSGRPFDWAFMAPTTGTNGSLGQPVQAIAFTHRVTSRGAVRIWNAATGRLLAGSSGSSEDFARIGHSLLALGLAVLGGHLSRTLHASARPGQAEAEIPASDHP